MFNTVRVKLLLAGCFCYLHASTVLPELILEAIDAGIKLIITITEGVDAGSL